MKLKSLLVLLFSSVLLQVSAQISLQIKPVRPVYMLYDSIAIRTLVRNYSSHPLAFGSSKALQGEVRFHIIAPDRTIVHPSGDPNQLLQGIILSPGEIKNFTFDLRRYFDLQEEGFYTIRMTVKHPQFSAVYESNETSFKIRKGRVLWQRKFGLPDYTGEKRKNGKIENRTYKLLSFADVRHIFYYMMIEDDKRVYAVRRIGLDMGSNLPPQREIDALARLHILLAQTPKIFVYYIYNFNGVLEKRDVYFRTNASAPELVLDPIKSTVRIDGGRLALKDVDYDELKKLPVFDQVRTKKNLFDTAPKQKED